MRRWGILGVALLLGVAAIALNWLGTGGKSTELSLDDPLVTAAWEYAKTSRVHQRINDRGEILKAWVTPHNQGYTVNIGTRESSEYNWLFVVEFDSSGAPVSLNVDLWRGTMVPRYLGLMSASLIVIWLLATYVVPHFAVKCPDCPPSLLNPPVTIVKDSTVYPGGFDIHGDSLPAIVRRDYICPRCYYTKVTYHVPGSYRPGHIFRAAWLGRFGYAGPVGELEWYQKALDEWHAENEKKARFKTIDEWRAFYDELKASEHEERRTRNPL